MLTEQNSTRALCAAIAKRIAVHCATAPCMSMLPPLTLSCCRRFALTQGNAEVRELHLLLETLEIQQRELRKAYRTPAKQRPGTPRGYKDE